MAGEFNPMGGDLPSIMGGFPGGGFIGAQAAGQQQAATIQELMARAQQQQAVAESTRAMIQPNVAEKGALTGLYSSQAGETQARTGGLELSNIARGANLPQEIGATGAEFGAKRAGAENQALMSRLTPILAAMPENTFSAIPSPSMRANAVDTFMNQSQVAKMPGAEGLRDYLVGGGNPRDYIRSVISANPEQFKTETQVAGGIKETELRTAAERYVADQRAASVTAAAQIRAESNKMIAQNKDPIPWLEAQLAVIPQGDPRRFPLEDQIKSAKERWTTIQGIRAMIAVNPAMKAQGEMIINTMLSGGEPSPLPQGTVSPVPVNPGTTPPGPGANPLAPKPFMPLRPEEPTATNPQTQERMVFRDGQWIPIPKQ